MSLRPSDHDDSEELTESLESARESVRRLEMDTHRVRSDLTRLEVALEAVKRRDDDATTVEYSASESAEDVAGGALSAATRSWTPEVVANKLSPAAADLIGSTEAPIVETQAAATQAFDAATAQLQTTADFEPPNDADWHEPLDGVAGGSDDIEARSAVRPPKIADSVSRRATPSFATSIALHGALVLVLISITVAAIVHHEEPFTTTILDLGKSQEKVEEPVEHFDLGPVATPDDAIGASENSQTVTANFNGPVVGDVEPVDFESPPGAPNEGKAGVADVSATELGNLPVGNGGLSATGKGAPTGMGAGNSRRGGGNGRTGGAPGSALFFGTQQKGDRFVFVVDNSSSMKGGRLELALAELVKTVSSLSLRQSFYVIFVSDKPYPMFYPAPEAALIPATPQNKQRLIEWLPKAILASGKNRELITAMDLAASLQPQAVYLLWDGDLKYSEQVRLDVMTHLTAPGWNFTVHTIGLGVNSLDSEQNLTAIAQAHHGVFRRVEIPKSRGR